MKAQISQLAAESADQTDLDTVRLRVEGAAVVELQDDEGESISLSHLLVVIQRWTLGKGECSVSRVNRTRRKYLRGNVKEGRAIM